MIRLIAPPPTRTPNTAATKRECRRRRAAARRCRSRRARRPGDEDRQCEVVVRKITMMTRSGTLPKCSQPSAPRRKPSGGSAILAVVPGIAVSARSAGPQLRHRKRDHQAGVSTNGHSSMRESRPRRSQPSLPCAVSSAASRSSIRVRAGACRPARWRRPHFDARRHAGKQAGLRAPSPDRPRSGAIDLAWSCPGPCRSCLQAPRPPARAMKSCSAGSGLRFGKQRRDSLRALAALGMASLQRMLTGAGRRCRSAWRALARARSPLPICDVDLLAQRLLGVELAGARCRQVLTADAAEFAVVNLVDGLIHLAGSLAPWWLGAAFSMASGSPVHAHGRQ